MLNSCSQTRGPHRYYYDMQPGEPPPDALARCMELFALHQRRLSLHISALLPDPADAEEILHETNIVIWKKFDQFEPGTDFLTWAYRIAFYQILEHRRRKAKSRAAFSQDLLRQLAAGGEREDAHLERRRAALAECRKKLPAEDRTLLEECYAPGARIATVAGAGGRKATSLYRSLRRIRQLLMECIERTLATEA